MTYQELLKDIKGRIRQAQVKAAMSANAEMLMLYWDIGRMIDARQNTEGWGSGIIPRLAKDIRNELTDIKGFSPRNLDRMLSFYRQYKELAISPPAVTKLDNDLSTYMFRISWAFHVILMEKVKELPIRLWYMQQIIEHGWTRDRLISMIKTNAHTRQGKAATNFTARATGGSGRAS